MITSLTFHNEEKEISDTKSSDVGDKEETKKDLTEEIDFSKYEDSDMKVSTTSYKIGSD
jgi:hypothetical protein